jgi:hypothetical protein
MLGFSPLRKSPELCWVSKVLLAETLNLLPLWPQCVSLMARADFSLPEKFLLLDKVVTQVRTFYSLCTCCKVLQKWLGGSGVYFQQSLLNCMWLSSWVAECILDRTLWPLILKERCVCFGEWTVVPDGTVWVLASRCLLSVPIQQPAWPSQLQNQRLGSEDGRWLIDRPTAALLQRAFETYPRFLPVASSLFLLLLFLLFLKPEMAYNILRDPETVVLKPSHPRKCPTSFSLFSQLSSVPANEIPYVSRSAIFWSSREMHIYLIP